MRRGLKDFRLWTAAEDAVVRAGGPIALIAIRIDRTETSVHKRRRALGISGKRRSWTADDAARLAQMIEAGAFDAKAIAAELGFSRDGVYGKIAAMGLVDALKGNRADHCRKLPPPSLDDRLRAIWGTAPLSRVARKLGVPADEAMAMARKLGLPGATVTRNLPMMRKAAPPKPKPAPKPVVAYDPRTVAWARANRDRHPEARMIAAMLDAGHARAA